MSGRGRTLSRVAVAAFVLMAPDPVAATAQPLTDPECARLLGGDMVRESLREAAARNLEADALRGVSGESARQTAGAVIAALGATGPDAGSLERLCAVLAIEAAQRAALLTGYYRPLVPARLEPDTEFRYPLYALPPPELRGRSRHEIDQGALEGTVPAVAWLNDPVEVFFVHIQGSALLSVPGGEVAVGYAGSNERAYTSIGAVLVRDGWMRREDVSMASLKAWLRAHPSERDAVLRANERYIYFRRVERETVGSLGVPLTAGRSLAADPAVYPPGTLLFVAPREHSQGVPPRLAFVQDRGSAIVGPGRLDLFLGTGPEAGEVAGALRQDVDVYILRPR